MTKDPILASRKFKNGNLPMVMFVEGGLEYIKANKKPYFTLTYTEHRRGFPNQCYSGGAGHEYIVKHFPQFADLAAMHLSDIDGVPMHAEANGWYDLAGALGGMGEQFHAGNSKRHFGPWRQAEYRKPTPEECLAIFAKHCRISVEEARGIAEEVLKDGPGEFIELKHRAKIARAKWAEICESMKPRWKAEAEACIKKHNLRVFGDSWEGEAA